MLSIIIFITTTKKNNCHKITSISDIWVGIKWAMLCANHITCSGVLDIHIKIISQSLLLYLRHRDVKTLIQNYVASKCLSWNWKISIRHYKLYS